MTDLLTWVSIAVGPAIVVVGVWWSFVLTLRDGGRGHWWDYVVAPIVPVLLGVAASFAVLAWAASRVGFNRVLFPIGGFAPIIRFNGRGFRCRRIFILPLNTIVIFGAENVIEETP